MNYIDAEDLRKKVSHKKDKLGDIIECIVTGQQYNLQVDHIVECQAVAVCINLLKSELGMKKDKCDQLVEIIKDEWINGLVFSKTN